jgi:hypothetical protein
MTARRYVTRGRIAALTAGLSPTDQTILADVARLNVASAGQLRRLHADESITGRRRFRGQLGRLTDERVLARLERRVGGERAGSDGFVYALDVLGQRITQPKKRSYRAPWTPQPMHLRHALAVSDLYVKLRLAATTDARLDSFEAEPASWRSSYGSGGGRLVLKPDAFVVIDGAGYQDRAFIEVDRATEALPRIVTKAKHYVHYYESGREQAQHGVFPLVVWIAPHERRRAQLIDALSRIDAQYWRLFAVTTDAHAAEQLINGAFTPLNDRKEANS